MTPKALFTTLNPLNTKYWILNTNRPSTFVENPLQIAPFMQNEPNFKIGKIYISIVLTRIYEKEMTNWPRKNEPKTNPISTPPLPKWAFKKQKG